ncbi:MAG: FAD-dependent oxidoreductase [Pseudomonadota bacterium]
MSRASSSERIVADVLVVGAGAFGLWTARACAARGMRVAVADAARIGSGRGAASATPIGALAPHRPAPWTPMKALQLRALEDMPARLAALEADTGRTTGYARPGRRTPLMDAAARDRAEAGLPEAAARWLGRRQWIEETARAPALVDPPFGWLRDDLSARLDPPATLTALRSALETAGATLLDGRRLTALDPPRVLFAETEVQASAIILATGAAAFDLIPDAPFPTLRPEHGQAARLALSLPPGTPLIQAPGLWIVPHADGTVAVGATSERDRQDLTTDAALDETLARAATFVPALANAKILQRWAGLRPRLATRKPLIGPVPRRPGLYIAAGGFKIGLALAPLLGEALADILTGKSPAVPPEILT